MSPERAGLVIAGTKTAVVNSRPVLRSGGPAFVSDGSHVVAKVMLGEARKLDLWKFAEQADQHHLSDEDRRTLWPDSKTLWAHSITDIEPVDECTVPDLSKRGGIHFRTTTRVPDSPATADDTLQDAAIIDGVLYKVSGRSLVVQHSEAELTKALPEAGDVGFLCADPDDLDVPSHLTVEQGLHSETTREYFVSGDPGFAGRLLFSKAGDEWLGHWSRDLCPAVLADAAQAGDGGPAMPATLAEVVPEELRFWKLDSGAQEARQELCDSGIFKGAVLIVDGLFRRAVTKLYLDTDHTVSKAGLPEPSSDTRKLGSHQPARLSKVRLRLPAEKAEGEDEQFILGIVLEPNDGDGGAPLDPDTQSDIYSAEEIRETAHKFMAERQHIGLMHKEIIDDKVQILESFIAPVDFKVTDPGTGKTEKVRKGSWLLAMRILDKGMWEAIKRGELDALSMGGNAIRTPEAA